MGAERQWREPLIQGQGLASDLMEIERNKKRTAALSILALGFVAAIFEAYLGIKGAPSSDKVMTIWAFGFALFSVYWVTNDARTRQLGSPYTTGFIMYVLWPVMLPAYFIKAGGKKGIIFTFVFFFAFVFPEAIWLALDSM